MRRSPSAISDALATKHSAMSFTPFGPIPSTRRAPRDLCREPPARPEIQQLRNVFSGRPGWPRLARPQGAAFDSLLSPLRGDRAGDGIAIRRDQALRTVNDRPNRRRKVVDNTGAWA